MTLTLRPLRNAKNKSLREIRNKTHEQLRREVEASCQDTEPPPRRPWYLEKD